MKLYEVAEKLQVLNFRLEELRKSFSRMHVEATRSQVEIEQIIVEIQAISEWAKPRSADRVTMIKKHFDNPDA